MSVLSEWNQYQGNPLSTLYFCIGRKIKAAYTVEVIVEKWRLLTGKYKLFRRSIKITYGKPYKVTDDLEIENKKLMNIITKMLIKERSNVKRKR